MGDLYDRMKRYERASDYYLPPRQALIIRVDGKAFHTYTARMAKPFDQRLMDAMTYAMEQTAEEMMGFKLAYHQSDEVTFMLTDYDRLETQGWFGYSLSKVVSVTASTFTAWFNHVMRAETSKLAIFDARVFVMPASDAPNVFVCRQQDWRRNSLSMLARTHFSQKFLDGMKGPQIREALHGIGVNWDEGTPEQRNGTFYLANGSMGNPEATYASVSAMIAGEVTAGAA